jgi:diphosphomevalonate decarboxylase
MALMQASARACSNIALCKYWGKSDAQRNLPAVPSLSLTLGALGTQTRVCFRADLPDDELLLNGGVAPAAATVRVRALLDRVRAEAQLALFAQVTSDNDFPTAAGLASSASGFAALALAARAAAGLDCATHAVSALARASSVSAARSVFPGFAVLEANAEAAQPLPLPCADIRMLVALTSHGPKAVGSTRGMLHTQETSPYYGAWCRSAELNYLALRAALEARDFERVGEAMEQSALMMHASMWAAAPALVYFTPTTLALMHAVYDLRKRGTFAYFTMDAGPHVKVLTLAQQAQGLAEQLRNVPGVLRVIESAAGPGAELIDAA